MALAEASTETSIDRSAVIPSPWPKGIPQNGPTLLQFLNDLQSRYWEKRAELAQNRDPRFDQMRVLELKLGPLTWTSSTQPFEDPQIAQDIQELQRLYEPVAVSGVRGRVRRLLQKVDLGA